MKSFGSCCHFDDLGPWTLEHVPNIFPLDPSRIKWDLTNGPLGKLLELLDTQV